MKHIKIYFSLVLILTLSVSCSDDFLDRQEPARIDLDVFYSEAKGAEQAIIGCYAPLQLPYYVSTLMLPDMMSEDAVKGSTYGDNSLQWNQMIEFQGVTTIGILDWKWDIIFEVIFKSNMVINSVGDIDMDPTRRDQILGEAYFLRALMYFDAIVAWGEVPLITTPLENYYIPKNTEAEIWAQIEADLKQAIEFLPEKSEWPVDQMGRATRGAAKALLGKTYIYQERFSEAEATLGELVSNEAEYSLDPDFGNIFTLEGENGSGSIFELQFAELGEPESITGAEGNFIIKFQGPRDVTGWGFNQGTFALLNEFGYYSVDEVTFNNIANYDLEGTDFQALAVKVNALSGSQYNTYQEFESALSGVLSGTEMTNHAFIIYRSAFKPTDPRFEHTFLFLGETVDGVYIDPNIATDHYTGVYNKKAFMADIPAQWRTAPINERMIRLSDIYLLYAEAAAQNNNLGTAKDYLNRVRNRASTGSDKTLAAFPDYANGAGILYTDTQSDLLEAIYNERRLELAFEHHRFWDLVRTGKAADVLGAFGYVEGTHNLWPIPQKDIDRSGGILTQNPGY